MIKNYIKVILRSLSKNRLFTLINILGLSFGMACFSFMSLWIWDELKYDKFHTNGDNIYQVLGERSVTGESHIVPYIPSSLVYHIGEQIPEVNHITRMFPAEVVIEKSTTSFSETGIYVDSSFLDIFSFSLKEGIPSAVFKNTNSIVITAKLADKYFPDETAFGKTITIIQQEKKQYVITGILENPPPNSSLQFDFIMPYEQFENNFRPWWKSSNEASYSNFNVTAYVATTSDSNEADVSKKLTSLLSNYSTVEDDALFIYPFEETYLHSDFSQGRVPTGRIKYVRILSIIALAVLLIACINFINLSSVLASRRKVEVGLRKVVGASKKQIIFQFITESVLISLASVILAITLVEILLPAFNLLTNKLITIPFSSGYFLLLLLLSGVGIGVLAGAYPALYFSSFEYFNTEGKTNTGPLSVFKKALIVIQFSCSVAFIVFTIVVFQQVDYINTKDLGIRTQNIIGHPLHGIKGHLDVYRKELLDIPGVESVSFTEQNPIGTSNKNNGVAWKGKPESSPIYFNVLQTGPDFTKTFDIELLEGKTFTQSSNMEEVQFLVNEAAAQQIMIDDIVGLPLTVWGNKGKVTGVIKNYHHQSLLQPIEPLVIICKPSETWSAYISLENTDKLVLEKIQRVYSKYESSYPFNFFFLEDQYKNKYGDVITAGNLSITFSIAAIVISCLGLFALSAFVMQNKLKEISIRKVMGAGTFDMIYQLSIGFIKLVAMALFVGFPLAWIYSDKWLSGFSYHTTLDYKPFVLAGVIAISIAFLTVLYNTFKASLTNPVESLKE